MWTIVCFLIKQLKTLLAVLEKICLSTGKNTDRRCSPLFKGLLPGKTVPPAVQTVFVVKSFFNAIYADAGL